VHHNCDSIFVGAKLFFLLWGKKDPADNQYFAPENGILQPIFILALAAPQEAHFTFRQLS